LIDNKEAELKIIILKLCLYIVNRG